jgi:cell wall-associated NlpC family hydrolase
MPFLVCIVPVSPVRAEASHKSEQTTQLLFGEACELLESTKDFLRIRVLYDNYTGWCQATQLAEITEAQLKTETTLLAADWVNRITIDGQPMQVPFGSSLTLLKDGKATFNRHDMSYGGKLIDTKDTLLNEVRVKEFAFKFLNTPYVWGGRSVFGVDCSGFCQVVFKCFGIYLLRDAYQQAMQGEAIGFLQEVKCGDLAFFDNEAGKITHVGILLESNTIIHSSGKVRIDTIDNLGIVNTEISKRTHNLRVIKRLT